MSTGMARGAALDKHPAEVAAMFDAGRRSLRPDQRRALAAAGPALAPGGRAGRSTAGPGRRVLDLAAGTGTSSRAVRRRRRPRRCRATSPSACSRVGAGPPARTWPSSPATPCGCRSPTAVFDAVTISFGLRNVADVDAALAELLRVTRPGGRLVVCEFSHPTWAPFRTVYTEYLMRALPAVARAGRAPTRTPTSTSRSRSGPGRTSRAWRRGCAAAGWDESVGAT